MTQVACQIVLHYSIARLSWKTVKSLRRSSRQRQKRGADANDNPSSTSVHDGDDDGDVDVSTTEYEILQGWTLLAFHSLFVSTGIEQVVNFVIPFYFHLKFILLLVTFVLPSWAAKRGGFVDDGSSEFGLSPAIPFWFDYVIVPGVHKVHEMMDHDPKGWAKQQLAMLPLLVLDLIVLPGVLVTEEERQLVRKAIMDEGSFMGSDEGSVEILEVDMDSVDGDALNTPSPKAIPSATPLVESSISSDRRSSCDVIESDEESKEKHDAMKENMTADEPLPLRHQDRSNCASVAVGNDHILTEVTGPSTNVALSDGISISTLDQSKETGDMEKQNSNEKYKIIADQTIDVKIGHQTPLNSEKKWTLFGDECRGTPSSLFSPNSPANSSSPNAKIRKSLGSLYSPVARSRVASSKLKLNRFSRDHPYNGGAVKSGEKKTSIKGEGSGAFDSSDDMIIWSDQECAKRKGDSNLSSPLKAESRFFPPTNGDSGKQKSSKVSSSLSPGPRKSGSKRKDRFSLGDQIREIVTGDANIRVRDHLFDLGLPSVPAPSATHNQTSKLEFSADSNSERKRRLRSKGGSLKEQSIGGKDFQSSGIKLNAKGSNISNNRDPKASAANVTTRRRSSRLAKGRTARSNTHGNGY